MNGSTFYTFTLRENSLWKNLAAFELIILSSLIMFKIESKILL